MPLRHIHIIIIVAAALLSALVSCRTGHGGDRPAVMTTIPPLQALASEIAGDSIEVRCMTASSADPETFDPSIAVMCGLYDSRMLLSVGTLPFERQVAGRLAGEAPHIAVVNVADSLGLLYGTHGHCGGAHHDDGEPDPHVWTSARSLSHMAVAVGEALGRADSANAAYYAVRAAAVAARLDSLDRVLAARMEPYAGDTVMVWHPSLSYFAHDYGLVQLPLGAEGKEGSVATMRRVLDAARGTGVRALFYQQPSDSARAAEAVRGTRLVPTLINPMSHDYINELITITDAIDRH